MVSGPINFDLMIIWKDFYRTIKQQKHMEMKTKILTICFLCFTGIGIEAQVSLEKIKQMYNDGKYSEAISYAEQFDYSKNAEALFVLGNCYFEKASQDEKYAMNMYNQALYNQAMSASMGIYVDNSYSVYLYNQCLNNVLQNRLKAIDLYSKSYVLGNVNALDKMKYISAVYGYSIPTNSSSFSSSGGNSNSFNQAKTSQKCSYCNGTGKVATTVATYGQTGTKWCNFCGREVPLSHCCQCKVCPSCGGKGYR
jgi:hypothetical protein